MKPSLLFLFILCLISCENKTPKPYLPTKVSPQHLDGEGSVSVDDWIKFSHRAAPGVDWRQIEVKNWQQIREKRLALRKQSSTTKTVETLANGNLTGEWRERGSRNQAGSMRVVDYDPETENIYGIGDGGTVFKGNLAGTFWNALNDDLQFDPYVIKVIKNSQGGKRLLATLGQTVYYSDDEGQNW